MSSAVSRETAQAPEITPVSRETRPSLLARALLGPIHAYQRFLSPALGDRCRFYPSCSSYTEQAIRELGAFRGLILGAWRLLRCNPLSKGGFDEVSDRRLFRPRHPEGTHA